MAPVVARPAVAKPARVKRAAAPKRKGAPLPQRRYAPDEEKNEVPKPEAHHVAVDVSTGMTTRRSLVVTTGVTAAVGGPLEKSGVRVHAEWMGLWSCCLGAAPKDSPLPQGVQLSNAALIGYEFVGEKGTMTGYVGIDVQNTPNALEDLPSHRSTRVGLQVSGDAYYTPTDSTMMSTNVSFSTNSSRTSCARNSAWRSPTTSTSARKSARSAASRTSNIASARIFPASSSDT